MPGSVIETLISRQIHQYNHLKALLQKQSPASPPPRRPVVTISRLAGCPTDELATALAERLGVQVWDSELVDKIASDKGLRRDFIAQLDEGLLSNVETWVRGMLGGRLFQRDDYALALAATVKTLAETGGALIVGRGAGFILGDRADLRLRLVAGPHRGRPDSLRARVLQGRPARSLPLRSGAPPGTDGPGRHGGDLRMPGAGAAAAEARGAGVRLDDRQQDPCIFRLTRARKRVLICLKSFKHTKCRGLHAR